MHVLGHCNFRCRYCYARFAKAQAGLPLEAAKAILAELPARGVTRVTFAGGEPTLHPQLLQMLKVCSELGLVANIVTNGSRIDRNWCRDHFPWLRWLTVSCDSHLAATNDLHGRSPRTKQESTPGVAEHVTQIAEWVREWNAARPKSEHVRLKVNIVVTTANADEDPTPWLRALSPTRVKLMQQVVIPGENEDAGDLHCSFDAFERYAQRVSVLADEGITVTAESSDQLHHSYSMIDPKGRFRQSRPEGYVTSAPILEVGMDQAWRQVGGYDVEVFDARGGRYEPGAPTSGPDALVVAMEGLDGSGKSTVAGLLAEALSAARVGCPPQDMRDARRVADAKPPTERRAWYYRAVHESMARAIDHVFAGSTVVMDRSPATTAAYAAAERDVVASRSHLPAGLAMPDAIFLLELPEDVRLALIHGRDLRLTGEENRLEVDDAFRKRVLAGYRALGAISVDASGTPEQIAAEVVRRIDRIRRASGKPMHATRPTTSAWIRACRVVS